jgi:FtsP/CotA-like multicopper oxidase with cupredoxin domain
MMGGLVMGITVTPRRPSPAVTLASAPRRLRLVAQQDSGGTTLSPAYGYVLYEGAKHSSDTKPLLPGPTIVVKRGEPVSITVVNQLLEATAVHWHGIELESYYDGVAGFSGAGQRISPAIAAHDSFEVRFTPPRSGTFMYHPHADELRQQQAGLTGALLVVDDLAKYDPTHDFVFVLTVPRRPEDAANIYINGSLTPPPLEIKAGDRYRLRIVNLHTSRPSMIARFVRDSATSTWTPVAKDGMDLPAQRRAPRTAQQQLGNGESYDFEVRPTEPGNYRFTVTTGTQVPLGEVKITVREAP